MAKKLPGKKCGNGLLKTTKSLITALATPLL